MKNLIKITRNYGVKFCWQERHFLEKPMEGVPYANESKKVELTPKGKEKKEELNHQESITRTLSAIKIGAEKMPNGFEKIPASEFLKRGAEDLQKLFIIDGVVNFHGNKSAYQVIGFSDLFPKVSEKQQFLVIENTNGSRTTYAYGARRKDGKIGYGNPRYKVMENGVKVSYFVGPPKQDNNQKIENYISFVEKNKDQKDSSILNKSSSKKEKTIPQNNDFSYESLIAESSSYIEEMEKYNLTPEEEQEEKKIFLERQIKRDNREKIARQKEAKLGLNENMNFKEKMTVIAKTIGELYELPWEVIYAQSALETGNGNHAPYNNYFGMKASKDWDGPSTENLSTSEDFGDGLEPAKAKFRGYSSMYDSAIGYAKFINKYTRYKNARENYRTGGSPYAYLMGIKEAGYATDAYYVYKVNKLFKSKFGYDIPGKI